jgi:hypothetical protein
MKFLHLRLAMAAVSQLVFTSFCMAFGKFVLMLAFALCPLSSVNLITCIRYCYLHFKINIEPGKYHEESAKCRRLPAAKSNRI